MPFSFDFGGFDPSAFGGFSGGDASQPQRPKRERKPRKAIGNAFTRTLINLGVTLLFGLGYFYFELPALNFHAEEFYVFVFLLCVVYCVCAVLTSGFQGEGVKGYFGFVKKQCTIPFLVLVALIAAIIIGGLTSWVVIRAGSYSKLLSIKDGDFASEVEEISYNQIPMLDEDSAARLGSRKLGELADMVSQFEILPSYTQINYQGRPVRVTSLAYGDLVKWFTNRSAGLPAYLIIDMVTQEAEVVRLDEGMKYTTAEHFGRYLPRHLRFHYPTYMFADPVFEINEEGEEEDPRAELVEKLLEYKMYKYMSFELRDMELDAAKSFYREKDVPREVEAYRPPLDYNELLKDMTLAKLQEIFEGILKRQEDKKDPVRSNFGRIEKDEVSVDQKAVYVEDFIRTHKRFSFRALLEKQHSKVEVIVTFLVVLELMKTGKITVEQASINDDMTVISREEQMA